MWDWWRRRGDSAIEARLYHIERSLSALSEQLMVNVQDVKDKLTALIASVAQLKTTDESMVALAKGLSGMIGDLQQQLATAIANSDFTGLSAVADGLDALKTSVDQQASAMSAAVVADTPAAPATQGAPTTPIDTGTAPADGSQPTV